MDKWGGGGEGGDGGAILGGCGKQGERKRERERERDTLLVWYNNIYKCTGLIIPLLLLYRPPRIRGFWWAHLRVSPLDLQVILLTMILFFSGWLSCCMTSGEHI